MSSLGDLVARIADEMDDQDLADNGQVLKAISSAVKEHRGKRFWFNQVVGKTFTITASQEFQAPSITVTGISTTEPITIIDLLRVDDGAGGNWRKIEIVDNALINARQDGNATGRPRYAALVNDSDGTRLRFFGIPDQAYTGELHGLIRFQDLADDGDSNPWTNDAETLIRQTAKRILMVDVTGELPKGSGATQAEKEALRALYTETMVRIGPTAARADELIGMQQNGPRYDITTDRYW